MLPPTLRKIFESCIKISFLAEDEGKIVGSVFTGHDGRRGYLFHFAVHPEYQDLKLAKELLKHSFEVLKAEGITRCFGFILAENERAQKLAELTGWERVTEFDAYSQWLVEKDEVKSQENQVGRIK